MNTENLVKVAIVNESATSYTGQNAQLDVPSRNPMISKSNGNSICFLLT